MTTALTAGGDAVGVGSWKVVRCAVNDGLVAAAGRAEATAPARDALALVEMAATTLVPACGAQGWWGQRGSRAEARQGERREAPAGLRGAQQNHGRRLGGAAPATGCGGRTMRGRRASPRRGPP